MSYILTEKDKKQLRETLKVCKYVEDTLMEYFQWEEDPVGDTYFTDDYSPKDFQMMVKMFQQVVEWNLKQVFPEHLRYTDDDWNKYKNGVGSVVMGEFKNV